MADNTQIVPIGELVGKGKNWRPARLYLTRVTEPGESPEYRLTINSEYIQLNDASIITLGALIQHRNSLEHPY